MEVKLLPRRVGGKTNLKPNHAFQSLHQILDQLRRLQGPECAPYHKLQVWGLGFRGLGVGILGMPGLRIYTITDTDHRAPRPKLCTKLHGCKSLDKLPGGPGGS